MPATSLEGNLIGTDAAGDHLGNAQGLVIASASNNTIGGTAAGAGNSIAFNGSGSTPGAVSVNTGTGNTILQDLILRQHGDDVREQRHLPGERRQRLLRFCRPR